MAAKRYAMTFRKLKNRCITQDDTLSSVTWCLDNTMRGHDHAYCTEVNCPVLKRCKEVKDDS